MEKPKYYLEEGDTAPSAYHRVSDFFAHYIAATGIWRMSTFSFSRFLHERNVREISEAEAAALTGGRLPDGMLAAYLDTTEKNRRG